MVGGGRRTEGGAGSRLLRCDESRGQDSADGVRKRGRAPTRTFHARSQLPAQSGLCLGPPVTPSPGSSNGAPRRGKGSAGKRSGERQGPAGPQPGASQRADGGHLAPRCASRAIVGRGSRSRDRGSAGKAPPARRGQAEVTELRAAATGSPPGTGCSMGGGAAAAGEGCSAAVRSGSRCPRLRVGVRTAGRGGQALRLAQSRLADEAGGE